MPETQPAAEPGVLAFGLARLATTLFRGGDIAPSHAALMQRLTVNPLDAGALLDLATLLQLCGQAEQARQIQLRALDLKQIFHLGCEAGARVPLRLLMFAVPGTLMANTPVEFLIDGMPISLTIAFLVPGKPFPQPLPPHDVVLVGIAESDEARPVLMQLAPMLAVWPKPVLNLPGRIADLARETLFEILAPLAGVHIPPTVRVSRTNLAAIACGHLSLAKVIADGVFPILLRPQGSHAGHGLQKFDHPTEITGYLAEYESAEFYLTPFVDYASTDRLFRKFRVASVAGQFFLSHKAISSHWMVHYLNAGMSEDAGKRAEEAQSMACFAQDFGKRHAAALAAIAQALDLDYFALDCAETGDGQLLVFEAGTAMIVHKMDPPELFPHKHAEMEKVSRAFFDLLARKAGCRDGGGVA